MKVYYKIKTTTIDTTTPDPEDKWDRASTSSDHIFPSEVFLSKESLFYDYFSTGLDLKSGDHIWLVFAVWSTGDSFGYDEDACQECFAAYKTPELAYKARGMLETARKKVELPEGFRVDYLPWKGYFESLSYVEVVEVTVV